jgi:hypothetical protein
MTLIRPGGVDTTALLLEVDPIALARGQDG